jgi:hypothetical protein
LWRSIGTSFIEGKAWYEFARTRGITYLCSDHLGRCLDYFEKGRGQKNYTLTPGLKNSENQKYYKHLVELRDEYYSSPKWDYDHCIKYDCMGWYLGCRWTIFCPDREREFA